MREVGFFERCSLTFLSVAAIRTCGDLLLTDDLCAYSTCLWWVFLFCVFCLFGFCVVLVCLIVFVWCLFFSVGR